MTRRWFALAPVLLFSAVATAEELSPALELIQTECLACHNPTKKTSGLDLTSREGALGGGKHGPAFVPGDSDKSRMWKLVSAGEMPFENPLAPEKRDIIREWIDAGAPWDVDLEPPTERPRAGKDWWSIQPLEVIDPVAPEGTPEAWKKSPIDRFVFSKLAEKGLGPEPAADQRTLIRRATFDLLGLPPTPEDVEAFVEDPAEDAYERLLDRLLASKHYGERWGRHWLDVIRFGESHGYEQNPLRDNAWPFRDYVIRSFNEDKPYDRLVIEHLAADRVADGDLELEVGLGFLVAGPHDTVGIDNIEGKLQQRANDIHDMITATGATFLALTVNCTRCHDHKFDPILQQDYYRLRAVFEGVKHGGRVLIAPKEEKRREAEKRPIEEAVRRASDAIVRFDREIRPRVEPRRDELLSRYRLRVNDRGTEETFPATEARFVRMRIQKTNSSRAVLDEFEIYTAPSAGSPSINVALESLGTKAQATQSRKAAGNPRLYSIWNVIDGEFSQSWISLRTPAEFTIELAKVQTIQRIVWSRDRLGGFQKGYARGIPTDYVIESSLDGKDWTTIASSQGRRPFTEEELEEDLMMSVMTAEEKARRAKLKAEHQARVEKLAALPPAPEPVYIAAFQEPKEPTRLFLRGNPMKPADPVPAASMSTLAHLFPGFELDPGAPEGERRLALARWLVDGRNPLTPRVLVNRIWHYHFGRGIVSTPSDFGFNGAKPTHPELLDWLAHRVQTLGWRLKPFHREIMLTQTYRQSSAHNAHNADIDSGAEYLWRFPPRRLEAEAIRDSILAVSGKLNTKMGGPGFRLYEVTVDNVSSYSPLRTFSEHTFRRSVYHQSPRSVRVALLGQYDCPDNSLPAPRREVTTSPLQALTLLNNAFVIDQARFFAERLERELPKSDREAQIRRAYDLAFGRSPTPEEVGASRAFIERRGSDGLFLFCRALFNTSEFIYVM